uniref:RGS domain-containing protein n=1 Tax=Heterorhabditis bacteriophora TaxID=37862 RepID=A0A1I7XT47_HETBA
MVVRLEFYDLTSGEEDNNELHVPGRSSRSASLSSNSSNPNELFATPSGPRLSSPSLDRQQKPAYSMSMFDANAKVDREAPPKPDPSGVEYPRAASWASGTCSAVLKDEKGCQLFRCFLFESLAEENLSFVEAVDKLKKMKSSSEKKSYAKEIVSLYAPYINLSSGAMRKMRDAADSDNVDPDEFSPAVKEVSFNIYLEFLEQLLPRSYAEKWTTSFEALLGNHVGRHHFRLFLRGIHAEENLRFWEAVVEFRSQKNKSQAQLTAGKSTMNTFLAEGANNEVFLPFGVRQVIERKIQSKEVDITLFDEATKHVEQVLRNDPYVRFLQSPQYLGLLAKLKN